MGGIKSFSRIQPRDAGLEFLIYERRKTQ
jgi:hypothetical protein